ncbi:unnamed protein product [Urochloa humidicola]
MESVEGMMERMKLSAAERKGIRVEKEQTRIKAMDPQAIGKVLAEKLVVADALAQTLGRIWCPIKGVQCKDLGENHFLFTFLQPRGKRRALEEGPWMFGKDLVVLMEVDESKSIEEMEFGFIPIWVRVMKLPFGMMNKTTGEAIGEEIGSFICMDLDEDGTAVGRYLRIKVRLDIRKPLMRGVSVFVGKEGDKPLWCPVEYEFLPDFCYTCGIIGHTDKSCSRPLASGEVQQFSKKLRCIPNRRRTEDGGSWFGGGRSQVPWRSGGGGSSGTSRDSYGKNSLANRGGSDAPSWRKDVVQRGGGSEGDKEKEEEEVTSPLKVHGKKEIDGKSKRVLLLEKEGAMTSVVGSGQGEKKQELPVRAALSKEKEVNSAMQGMHVDEAMKEPAEIESRGSEGGVEKKGKGGKYKKLPRDTSNLTAGTPANIVGRKRAIEGMEIDDMGGKKQKAAEINTNAGLSEQPCENQ